MKLTFPFWKIFLILFVMIGSAIAKEPNQQWRKSDLDGLSISLIDPAHEESYDFHKDGYVAAIFGKKNSYLTAPLLRWKLKSGNLIIYDDKIVIQKLRLLQKNKKTITAINRYGKVITYKVY